VSRSARRHHVKRLARKRRPLDRRGASDNELATHHPLDCGRRCWLCHYDKLAGNRPPRERARLDAMRAEIEDAA
jgi:hypothetical protein